MLTKAIIEEVIDTYSAKVRIPIYHQIEPSPFATNIKDLPIASICVLPGTSMALRKNDVVFVDFEMDQVERPVIIGCLSREDSSSSCNINAQSLKVEVDCTLPGDTSFGEAKDLADINQENIFVEVAQAGGGESDIEFYTD